MVEFGEDGLGDSGERIEQLSEKTEREIRAKLRLILDAFGIDKDSELSQLKIAPEYRDRLVAALGSMGLTEETPLLRQAMVPIDDPRLLPEHLRSRDGLPFLLIAEALTSHIPVKLKVIYGIGQDPMSSPIADGLEVWLPWEDENSKPQVLSRDPATHRPTSKPMTEPQGQKMIRDLKDVLGEKD